MKVRGKMEATVTERGCTTSRTLHKSYTLWPNNRSSVCPVMRPFSVLLPGNFRDEDHAAHLLPPSYDITLPGFFVKTSYCVSIIVNRNDHRYQFLSSDKTYVGLATRSQASNDALTLNLRMSVPFCYRPGAPTPCVARAPRTFLSDIKITPDAWRQTIIQIPTLPAVSFEPLHLCVRPSHRISAVQLQTRVS
jgi:hypothetical protein